MSERFKFSYIVYCNMNNDNLHGEDVAQLELEIELVPRPRQLRFSGDPLENCSPTLVKPCITSRIVRCRGAFDSSLAAFQFQVGRDPS